VLPAISARWMPISQDVSSGVCTKADAHPPNPVSGWGSVPLLVKPYLLGKPLPGRRLRSMPQAAKRGRGTRQP
jgi:hypothetical protein